MITNNTALEHLDEQALRRLAHELLSTVGVQSAALAEQSAALVERERVLNEREQLLKEKDLKIALLNQEISVYRRWRFDKRSEAYKGVQRSLFDEDIDADLAAMQAELKALLYFWLLAATDGHAKNFSLAIAPGGTFKLAPLYDVLSAWPWVGSSTNKVHLRNIKMAMALHTKNAHYRMREIYQRHWLAVGDGISAQGLQRPSWKSYQVPWKVQSHLCKRKFRKDFPFMS